MLIPVIRSQSHGIRVGTISAVYPHLGLYTIIDHYGSYVTGVALSLTGHSIFGSEAVKVFSPGCEVLYIYIDSLKLGIILGALPEKVSFPGTYKQEELVPGSYSGYLADPFVQVAEQTLGRYGLLERYRGTYIDAIPGDVTQISRSGTALFTSPFLVGLKANEFCGVWANYIDSLLRIAGWNFQEWTSGYEKATHVNWNLIWEYEGHAATIFEQLGYRRAFEPSSYSFWETGDRKGRIYQRVGPLEIAYNSAGQLLEIPGDNSTRNQSSGSYIKGNLGKYRLPFHTRQIWGGILSPGKTEFLFAQPDSIEGYSTESTPLPRPLVQQGTTHTGIWYVKSTNAILLCKFPWVSAPVRVVDIDEKSGSIKYGKVRQAERYLYRQDLNTKQKDFTTIRCNSLYDIQNYITNWEAKLGFYIFSDKFEFITEEKQQGIRFHQYGKEKPVLKRQRRSASFIYMDPYGDIILENGAGASIELIGDTIRISAPGGVLIDAGYQIKMYSNYLVQLAETDHYSICGRQFGTYIGKDGVNGLIVSRAGVLIPIGTPARIHSIYAKNILTADLSLPPYFDPTRPRDEFFILKGNDLTPLASAVYPAQRWEWSYYKNPLYARSSLVAMERLSPAPSTFELDRGSKEPEPSKDENKLIEKEFGEIFKRKVSSSLLFKKHGENDYSVQR
jgi:hypothetical protein